jgi:ATP-binding cassette subfamily D (ALD) protein 4
MYLIFRLTSITEQAVKFTDLISFTSRISQILECADDVNKDNDDSHPQAVVVDTDDDSIKMVKEQSLVLYGVQVASPDKAALVEDLTLTLSRGKNLLIVGPNGSGKTSLLRMIAGVWPTRTGTIAMQTGSGLSVTFRRTLQFIPQKAYLVTGTMRDQLAYPRPQSQVFDADIRSVLQTVGLTSLLDDIRDFGVSYSVADWEAFLSPGQVQKLAFARAFLAKATFLLLDEATSAMDAESEETLYKECVRRGIWMVSVGHRASIKPYHQCQLVFDGQGKWRLEME